MFNIIACIYLASFTMAMAGGSLITLRHSEGGRTVDYQYTSNATTTRIDRLGEPTTPPSPWNLIDRATGSITILSPHNQSITTLAADAFDQKPSHPQDAKPTLSPPGIIQPHPPELQHTPPNPALPPGDTESPAIPAIPAMAPGEMPPIRRAAMPVLTPHEEIREIHGHTCTRYTLSIDNSLEIELWLTESPELPPFYLLLWDGPPLIGQNNLLLDWPHLIRKEGKFPLLATLRESNWLKRFPIPDTPDAPPRDPQPERPDIASWEVISISPATPEDSRFNHPESYFNTQHP